MMNRLSGALGVGALSVLGAVGVLGVMGALGAPALAGSSGAGASDPSGSSSGPEATIPFANFSIYDWAADGTRGIYIQTLNRQWYYAKLFAPCIYLPFALRVGFVTEPGSGQFNRFSSILVQGQQCRVQSLMKSGPPPSKDKRWRSRQSTREAAGQDGTKQNGASR